MTGIREAAALAGIRLHKGDAHFCDGFALPFGRHAAGRGLVDVVEEAMVGSFDERVIPIRLLIGFEPHAAQLGGYIQVLWPASVLVAGDAYTGRARHCAPCALAKRAGILSIGQLR